MSEDKCPHIMQARGPSNVKCSVCGAWGKLFYFKNKKYGVVAKTEPRCSELIDEFYKSNKESTAGQDIIDGLKHAVEQEKRCKHGASI